MARDNWDRFKLGEIEAGILPEGMRRGPRRGIIIINSTI